MNESEKPIEPLPFVAPCRLLDLGAPLRWIKLGFSDALRAPAASLSYGFIMAALIMSVSFLAWQYGSAWLMLSLLCSFVFVAPIVCVGTYAISAQLERGLEVSFKRTLRACLKRYLGTELVFALVLLIIFLVWARASSMVSVFIPSTGEYQLTEMVGYLGLLALISLIFLSITFATSVFSLPMIMHRDVDAITAAITSINAVLRNRLVMCVWGIMIAAGIVLSLATAGLALVIFLPAVGHAVWHGYLETIDSTAFPRHKTGITATKRPVNADRRRSH
ncbi:MAG: DUF2189 domain-containing protein [Pseudomonadota bacterium]